VAVATTESVRTESDRSGPVGAGDDGGGASADADATGTETTAATAAATAATRLESWDSWDTVHLHVRGSSWDDVRGCRAQRFQTRARVVPCHPSRLNTVAAGLRSRERADEHAQRRASHAPSVTGDSAIAHATFGIDRALARWPGRSDSAPVRRLKHDGPTSGNAVDDKTAQVCLQHWRIKDHVR
jgi:hypothetical protein